MIYAILAIAALACLIAWAITGDRDDRDPLARGHTTHATIPTESKGTP